MKNTSKRFLSLLLAMMMVVSIFTVAVAEGDPAPELLEIGHLFTSNEENAVLPTNIPENSEWAGPVQGTSYACGLEESTHVHSTENNCPYIESTVDSHDFTVTTPGTTTTTYYKCINDNTLHDHFLFSRYCKWSTDTYPESEAVDNHGLKLGYKLAETTTTEDSIAYYSWECNIEGHTHVDGDPCYPTKIYTWTLVDTTPEPEEFDNSGRFADKRGVVVAYRKDNSIPSEPRIIDGSYYNFYSSNGNLLSGGGTSTGLKPSQAFTAAFSNNYESIMSGPSRDGTTGVFTSTAGALDGYLTGTVTSLIYNTIVANKLTFNPTTQEVIIYVIKYQTNDNAWHIDFTIKDKAKLAVVYNGNANTGGYAPDADNEVVPGSAYTIKNSNTLVKEGYTFTGWNTDPNGAGSAYSVAQEITLTSNLYLYAQWRKNEPEPDPTPSIPVKFYVLNPTYDAPADGGNLGTEKYFPYSASNNNKGWTYVNGNPGGSLTDAGWAALRGADDKLLIGDKLLGDLSDYLNMPSDWDTLATVFGLAPGYVIVPYVIKIQGGNGTTGPDDNGVKADIHVDCYIAKVDTTVTYHPNYDNRTTFYSETVKTGSSYTVKAYDNTDADALPARDGYVFLGWSTSASGDVVYKAGDVIETIMSATNLYAQWAKIEKGSFVVAKTDENEAALEGATFTLTDKDGVEIKPTVDKNLHTFSDLEIGTYTLTETAPDGYTGAGPWTVTVSKDKSVTVVTDEGGVISKIWKWIVGIFTGDPETADTNYLSGVLTVANAKIYGDAVRVDGTLEITKNDDTEGSPNPLAGAAFTLYNSEGTPVATSAVTGKDGKTTISTKDLEEGTYTLSETTFPEGYGPVASNEWTVDVSNSSATALVDKKFVVTTTWTITINESDEIAVANSREFGEFTMQKLFSGINNLPEGFAITLTSDDGTVSKTYTVGSSGDAWWIAALPTGKYTVAETGFAVSGFNCSSLVSAGGVTTNGTSARIYIGTRGVSALDADGNVIEAPAGSSENASISFDNSYSPISYPPTSYSLTTNWIGINEDGSQVVLRPAETNRYNYGDSYSTTQYTFEDWLFADMAEGSADASGTIRGNIIVTYTYSPDTDIPDPSTPLGTPTPTPTDEVDIPDPTSPIGTPDITPDEEVDIPDPSSPTSDTPKTGDDTNLTILWMLLAVSAIGTALCVGNYLRRRKHD